MRIALIVLAAAPFALTALPAQAQSRNGDPVASAAIFDGNFSQAEQQLSARLRLDPDQPELLLNLAAVYAQTGRTSQARALYIRVLQQRDVEMDLSADRVSTSHVVANKGLQYIRTLQLSAR
ncbi:MULTISPECIES: tetratricopeptide repeat protein [unclassified Sphingomonas]|jgi:Flp pilus assembly protein TadD|nr:MULTISPECIES: tetratricopeptide repeat protein [unclassified Sphingomonas]